MSIGVVGRLAFFALNAALAAVNYGDSRFGLAMLFTFIAGYWIGTALYCED